MTSCEAHKGTGDAKESHDVRVDQLRDAGDENLVAAFAALIPHVGSPAGGTRSFGSVVATATGLEVAFYNPVMATGPGSNPDDVVRAIQWLDSIGVRPSAQIHPDGPARAEIEAVLRDRGFEPDPWVTPGMALQPIPRPPPRPAGLRIEKARSETLDDWHTALTSGPNFRRAFPPSVLDDPAFRLVTGYLDGEPVAAAAGILTGDVVGVYAVGTAEKARRRGFGRAMTWAAIEAGVNAGCRIAILQSSEMAVSLYEGMGFVEVCRHLEYQRSDPSNPS